MSRSRTNIKKGRRASRSVSQRRFSANNKRSLSRCTSKEFGDDRRNYYKSAGKRSESIHRKNIFKKSKNYCKSFRDGSLTENDEGIMLPPPIQGSATGCVESQKRTKSFFSNPAPFRPFSIHNDVNKNSEPNLFRSVKETYLAWEGEKAQEISEKQIHYAALCVKVENLKEHTKGLKCNKLIDLFFGEGKNISNPPNKQLRKLKDIIAMELTANEFARYSKITDIESAELFRKTNESLELLQQQQIMSNPIFSNIFVDDYYTEFSALPNNNFLTPSFQLDTEKYQMSEEGLRLEVSDDNTSSALNNYDENSEKKLVHPEHKNTSDMLHFELYEILKQPPNSEEKYDPLKIMHMRRSFLTKLLRNKTSAVLNWLKFIRVMSSVATQAITVLNGTEIRNVEEKIPFTVEGNKETAYGESVDTNSSYMDQLKRLDVGSLGADLVFGAIIDTLQKNFVNICMSVGELALILGVPIVLVKWPKEITNTNEYKHLLTRSLPRFAAENAIPSMYIIDHLMREQEEQDREEEKKQQQLVEENGETSRENNASIRSDSAEVKRRMNVATFGLADKDKQKAVRDVFNRIVDSGNHSMNNSSNMKLENYSVYSNETAFSAATSIINNRVAVCDNIATKIIDHLDKKQHIISLIVSRLLQKAKLAATVYWINNSLGKDKTKNKTTADIPLRQLMPINDSIRRIEMKNSVSKRPISSVTSSPIPFLDASASNLFQDYDDDEDGSCSEH